jgi:hypothetical protein
MEGHIVSSRIYNKHGLLLSSVCGRRNRPGDANRTGSAY